MSGLQDKKGQEQAPKNTPELLDTTQQPHSSSSTSSVPSAGGKPQESKSTLHQSIKTVRVRGLQNIVDMGKEVFDSIFVSADNFIDFVHCQDRPVVIEAIGYLGIHPAIFKRLFSSQREQEKILKAIDKAEYDYLVRTRGLYFSTQRVNGSKEYMAVALIKAHLNSKTPFFKDKEFLEILAYSLAHPAKRLAFWNEVLGISWGKNVVNVSSNSIVRKQGIFKSDCEVLLFINKHGKDSTELYFRLEERYYKESFSFHQILPNKKEYEMQVLPQTSSSVLGNDSSVLDSKVLVASSSSGKNGRKEGRKVSRYPTIEAVVKELREGKTALLNEHAATLFQFESIKYLEELLHESWYDRRIANYWFSDPECFNRLFLSRGKFLSFYLRVIDRAENYTRFFLAPDPTYQDNLYWLMRDFVQYIVASDENFKKCCPREDWEQFIQFVWLVKRIDPSWQNTIIGYLEKNDQDNDNQPFYKTFGFANNESEFEKFKEIVGLQPYIPKKGILETVSSFFFDNGKKEQKQEVQLKQLQDSNSALLADPFGPVSDISKIRVASTPSLDTLPSSSSSTTTQSVDNGADASPKTTPGSQKPGDDAGADGRHSPRG